MDTETETESLFGACVPHWPDGLRKAVLAQSVPLSAEDGACLFGPGDDCRNFLIALKGAVRVEHMSAGGRSIVLYRVRPGETCVMTTSCLMAGKQYDAYGYAEGAVAALALPAEAFRHMVDEEPEFRRIALGAFSQRVVELVEVIDELLLRRVDLRLAAWLAERAQGGAEIAATHQAVASELGTAREVVSRLLKEFERRGFVQVARGAIRVMDGKALKRLAREAGN